MEGKERLELNHGIGGFFLSYSFAHQSNQWNLQWDCGRRVPSNLIIQWLFEGNILHGPPWNGWPRSRHLPEHQFSSSGIHPPILLLLPPSPLTLFVVYESHTINLPSCEADTRLRESDAQCMA